MALFVAESTQKTCQLYVSVAIRLVLAFTRFLKGFNVNDIKVTLLLVICV